MIVLRLIAFLLRRRVVKLLDTKGDVRLTITRSRHHSWADEQRAWVNPLSRVGSVTLLDDGSCGGRASGFVGWKYY